MTKKRAFAIVGLSVVLSLIANIFLGRYLVAEISTIPFLNRWKLMSPQAPIVINTREEVRITDSGDISKSINDARSKISAVLSRSATGSPTTFLGGAVNLTSDGLLLSVKQVIGTTKAENLFVKLDNGSVSPVTQITGDPATDLVILSTVVRGSPIANISSSKNVSAGQRVMLLAQDPEISGPVIFKDSFISSGQKTESFTVQDADLPRRAFSIQEPNGLVPGQSIISQNGEIIGIWSGSGVVVGDIIKDFFSKFLSEQGKKLRPSFGFRYSPVSSVDVKISAMAYGLKIISVSPVGPAQKTGLGIGDIITEVNNTPVIPGNLLLEELLQSVQIGDNVQLTVRRGKDTIKLSLIAGELK